MGGICSKSSNTGDNFSQPGRVLGAAPQSKATTAPVPQKVASSAPGRTLGSRDGAASPSDARSAAAKAAEERAAQVSSKGAPKPGKLSAQLAEQKKLTTNALLNSSSAAERQARDADASTEARNYN